jgi:hypothetical protein
MDRMVGLDSGKTSFTVPLLSDKLWFASEMLVSSFAIARLDRFVGRVDVVAKVVDTLACQCRNETHTSLC